MKRCKIQIILPVIAGLTLLSACGQNSETAQVSEAASVELPNGMSVKEQIEARQAQLKHCRSSGRAKQILTKKLRHCRTQRPSSIRLHRAAI